MEQLSRCRRYVSYGRKVVTYATGGAVCDSLIGPSLLRGVRLLGKCETG